jgi:hypothetical protein
MVLTIFQKASSLIWDGIGSDDMSSEVGKIIAMMQAEDTRAAFKKLRLEIMSVIIGGAP